MSDLLGDYHKRDAELQNSTSIDIDESLDICLCFDHFTNQSEKRVKIRLAWEISDTCLNKSQAEKLIQALQKLVQEL